MAPVAGNMFADPLVGIQYYQQTMQTSFTLPRLPQLPKSFILSGKGRSLTRTLTHPLQVLSSLSLCLVDFILPLVLTKLFFCFKVKFMQNSFYILPLTFATRLTTLPEPCPAASFWNNEKVDFILKMSKKKSLRISK